MPSPCWHPPDVTPCSHSLGTISGAVMAQNGAGGGRSPPRPLQLWGLTEKLITAEAQHAHSTDALKAGACPRLTPWSAGFPRAADAQNPTIRQVARKATGFSWQRPPLLDLSPSHPSFGQGVLEAAAAYVLVAGTEHHAGITSGHPTAPPTQCQSMEEQLAPCGVHSPRTSITRGNPPSPCPSHPHWGPPKQQHPSKHPKTFLHLRGSWAFAEVGNDARVLPASLQAAAKFLTPSGLAQRAPNPPPVPFFIKTFSF